MKTKTLLLLCVFFSIVSFSQKSAPVVGDAAILIDLLKKDYNTINPETKNDEIIRDRARVIGIFKSYLKDKNTTINKSYTVGSLKFVSVTDPNLDLLEYNKAKNDLETYKKLTTFTKIVYNNLISNIKTHRDNYINNSYSKHLNELIFLHEAYDSKTDKNVFLQNIIEVFIQKYVNIKKSKIDNYSETNYQSSIQKSLPFLGGNLAFETVIDGLSRFLANRIKEELTTYVIQEIQKRLNNPSPQSYLNELMVLLPRTTNYLKRFDADQVLNFIDDVKQYIEDDLNNILINANGLRNTPRFIQLMNNNPELDFAFEALELIPKLSKVKRPIDYFDILENSTLISEWSNEDIGTTKKRISTGIRLASMLAHSLTILDNGELRFATIDFMSNYASEPHFYKLYIGFLHQQNIKYYEDITFKGKDKKKVEVEKYLFNIVMNHQEKYEGKIKNILSQIITPAERLHNNALSIKKAKDNNEKVSMETVHSFIKGTISLSETIVKNTQDIFDIAKNNDSINAQINIKKPTEKYFQLANVANDIFLDIHNKKYSIAIIKALEIYPILIKNQSQKIPSIVLTSEALLKNQEMITNIIAILKIKKYPTNRNEISKLKDIALTLELLLKRIEWDNDDITNNTIYKAIESLLNIILKDKSIDAYNAQLKNLKNLLEKQYPDFVKNFTSINTDKLPILVLINEFIDENIKKQEHQNLIKEEIKDKTKTFIDKFLYTAFKNATLDFESINIDDKKDYTKALKDITKTVQVLAPEIIQETFNIKDNRTIKLVHFLNDIALSESSEDVEKAISAFALPAGSFALKQKKGPFIAVNAFPGVLIGSEQRSFSSGAFTIGFTAPIGLYTKIGNGRWGLFAPIIDIAAPVRFRLDSDSSTSTLPEFSFKNILSPGLYITHRVGKSPFTISIGGQIGPELQKIENNSTTTFSDSFRVGVSFTLDIPLLTLYRRPKLD